MGSILAIDPGDVESAWVLYDADKALPSTWGKVSNDDLMFEVLDEQALTGVQLAVEMVASYGMPVGREVFDTCVWIGRFLERWGGGDARLVYRSDVKLHLTHSRRSKDANVRQALLDKFGPGKELAVGKKASPGPLYGLTGDCWSALGVAVTAAETEAE